MRSRPEEMMTRRRKIMMMRIRLKAAAGSGRLKLFMFELIESDGTEKVKWQIINNRFGWRSRPQVTRLGPV